MYEKLCRQRKVAIDRSSQRVRKFPRESQNTGTGVRLAFTVKFTLYLVSVYKYSREESLFVTNVTREIVTRFRVQYLVVNLITIMISYLS